MKQSKRQRIIALLDRGMSLPDIAHTIGCHLIYVYEVQREVRAFNAAPAKTEIGPWHYDAQGILSREIRGV